VEHYIQHRWQKAGATNPHPFQPEAVVRVAQCSRGIPRLVNVLCDNALMLAYGEGSATIGLAQIDEVARDLDLVEPPGRMRPRQAAITETPLRAERGPLGATANGSATAVADRMAPGPAPIPILERYRTHKPSRLTRLAGKLGFTR
jgi:general secretion pathway protein A